MLAVTKAISRVYNLGWRARRGALRQDDARFDQVAPGDNADVVLWQVGTNAVLRDDPLGPVDRLIKEGLARMKAVGADVVVIDPQFAPKVLAKPDAEDMVHLIAAAAAARGVDLFHRFAIMRAWHLRGATYRGPARPCCGAHGPRDWNLAATA
jgi:hypothetical protein